MRRRDWPQALDRFDTCLAKFPDVPAASAWLANRASVLIELGRLDEAETDFLALAQSHPEQHIAFDGLGRVAMRRGNWELEKERWEVCLQRFPTAPMVAAWRTRRASVLERLQSWHEAYDAWRELISQPETAKDAHFHQALCLYEWQGQTDEADRLAQSALKLYPTDTRVMRLMGRIATSDGNIITAQEWSKKCIELEPFQLEHYAAAMNVALRGLSRTLADWVIAVAPPDVAMSTGFRCRVLLPYHQLRAETALGLELISGVQSDEVDWRSADAVGLFLQYAQRYDLLEEFTTKMIARIPDNPAIIAQHLTAVQRMHGRPMFEGAKERLFAPLRKGQIALVLNRLMPSLMSVSEARLMIDETIKGGFARGAGVNLLFKLAYRGELEIIEYLAAQLKLLGNQADRLGARLFMSTAEDRYRISRTALGGVAWTEFADAARRLAIAIDEETKSKAISEQLRRSMSSVADIGERAAANWINSAESYHAASSLAAWLADRIHLGIPTSLLRLGDGEGMFLPYLDEESRARGVHFIQRVWWGEQRLAPAEAVALGESLMEAIRNADAVGVPPPRRLLRDLQGPLATDQSTALENILRLMSAMAPSELRQKVLTSCHIHTDLDYWDLYRQILAGVDTVSVISCHDLGEALSTKFGVSVRRWFAIPPEYHAAPMFEAANPVWKEKFYPDVFEQIMEAIAPLPGEVFLVAAGFLGKLLCDRVRDRGGIGVDIGSIADLWLGYSTRVTTDGGLDFDIASSLIEGQPFRHHFTVPSEPGSTPCCSDNTRHHNIAAIAHHVVSPTQSFSLRIIGHPRCGSAYVAQVFRRLGVEIGHERIDAAGICGWMHAVEDLNMPYKAPAIDDLSFSATLAYVRDPETAIPSIILENGGGQSFGFRRFHVARQLGIDIARHRDPIARAVDSYLCWMRIVDRQNPLAILRVESLLEDLLGADHALSGVCVSIDWGFRALAQEVPHDLNSSEGKVRIGKPKLPPSWRQDLPSELAVPLCAFCERFQYASLE
jgi:tetratricopeptide (TPR) repeat protein